MANALFDGLKSKYRVTIVTRETTKNKNFDINNRHIIFAIKPYALREVAQKLDGKANTIYSILAGTTLKSLKESINSKYYVRAMPNIAAQNQKSMTSLCGDTSTKNISIDIFNSIGNTLWLNSEKEIDIATAIAGSGPAFLALVAEAISDGGVNMGLKRDNADILVQGLFESFNSLIGSNPVSHIKNSVMSPAGTTSAGVQELEKKAVRSAFIQTIEKSVNRAVELSKL